MCDSVERLKCVAQGLDQKTRMYSEPIILPLNADGKLYALEDEQGQIIGTGTREICEALLSFMKNEAFIFRRVKPDEHEPQC